MPEITFPFLDSINSGVSLAYNTQFGSAPTVYRDYSYEVPSTGSDEVYPRLDMIPGLREWVGDRVVHNLSLTTFTIANKEFEETIAVLRKNFEDDKYGFLTAAAQQLGLNAARLPDLLTTKLLLAGHTTPCYDGQNFFDVAHPTYTNTGAPATAINYASGASPVWYLFDTTGVVKPMIWQTRRPFQVIPRFSMQNQEVFWNKEFAWGVDGRCNAGFGLWQLAFMSTQALTSANLLAARTAMMSYRRPDGSPLGIRPNLLMTGTANYSLAQSMMTNDFDLSVPTTLTVNPVKGMFKVLENQWLN